MTGIVGGQHVNSVETNTTDQREIVNVLMT